VKSSTSEFDFKSSVIPFPVAGASTEIPSKERIGSKAHNLMRMAALGLPVPPGFVVCTDLCHAFLQHGWRALDALFPELNRALHQLGETTGRHFGDPRRPLLVSVRSGAAVSMPGMMETILNIGLNRITAKGLVRLTGNPRLAADCRRRLVSQYGEVVAGIPPQVFASQLQDFLDAHKVSALDELDSAGLMQLAELFENTFAVTCGTRFPADPLIQLNHAVGAVLNSWCSKQAETYRRIHSIADDIGTAVIVQAMVFGNQGPTSGAGVGFTRNPADGTNALYVDYLANAQGEDVVSGRRVAMGPEELQRRAPAAYQTLLAARGMLEQEFAEMQDFEFTVEDGRLLLLQTRCGKRTPLAALRIARDLVAEGLITPPVAIARLKEYDLEAIEEVRLANQNEQPLLHGTAAGAGVAVGAAVFDPARVHSMRQSNKDVVLVCENAETSDIEALAEASALISSSGARTSHAAVVARQLGKPCVVGCAGLVIAADARSAWFGDQRLIEGDLLSVDGERGVIYRGALDVIRQRPVELLDSVASWGST